MQTPDDDALGAIVRQRATRHRPRADLAASILADVRSAAAVPVATPALVPPVPTAPPVLPRWRRWLQPVTMFGAGAACAWLVSSALLVADLGARLGDRTADEVAAGHVRSLMAAHLFDVASTDQHTVKPWFAGRLDFSPPVHDLAAPGFALAGGRLDRLVGRPVAALVYRRQQHLINLFIWPIAASGAGEQPATAPEAQMRQGYNLDHWAQRGMQFWAVSDASAHELRLFTAALRARVDATASP